jgi:hypothetical protein
VKHWKTIHFKPKRALITSIILSAIFLIINSNILVLFGYEEWNNGTHLFFCIPHKEYPATYWMNTYGQIHSVGLYSLAPFSLLAVADYFLVAKIYKRPPALEHDGPDQIRISLPGASRRARMNRTVLILNLLFIAFTLPIACASFFFDTLFASDWGVFIITLLDEASFTFHAGSFLINFFSNIIFRSEVALMFSKQVSSELPLTSTLVPTRGPKF